MIEIEKPELYTPNYMSFNNQNTFLGSYDGLRFKLVPDVADPENKVIHAEYWYGPLCYEKSIMDGKADFPLSDEGIAEMKLWLTGLSETPPADNGLRPQQD